MFMKWRAIYSHAADLDGLVAGLHLEFLTGAPLHFLDYGQEDRIAAAPCIIADLNLANDHPALADERNLIIDHHADRRGPVKAEVIYREGECAALMVVNAGGKLGRRDRGALHPYSARAMLAWAKLAQAADYMLTDAKDYRYARDLTSFMRIVGVETARTYLQGGSNGLTMWPYNPTLAHVRCAAAIAGAVNARERERGRAAAQQSLSVYRVGSLGEMGEPDVVVECMMGVLPCGSVSEIAGDLSERLGKPVALVLLGTAGNEAGTIQVGIRGEGAREIAQRFGGGGHPTAAGWTVKWRDVGSAITAAATEREA